jgi:hypothetical protein
MLTMKKNLQERYEPQLLELLLKTRLQNQRIHLQILLRMTMSQTHLEQEAPHSFHLEPSLVQQMLVRRPFLRR